jgi:peptidoglycan L-alanyl-D-glutamate endopeptidase CwlK
MSARVLKDDVLFFQRLLRADGLYLARLDGRWGPKTEAAAVEFDRRSEEIRDASRTFDVRSEENITTLALAAQRQARDCLARLVDSGAIARIISGTRTYAEQDALFRRGRNGVPGPRVTNARGGESNHNFGVAWDVGLFGATGTYFTDAAPYVKVSLAGKSDLVEWGGDWTTFADPPHYQFKLEVDSIAELRNLFETGRGAEVFT